MNISAENAELVLRRSFPIARRNRIVRNVADIRSKNSFRHFPPWFMKAEAVRPANIVRRLRPEDADAPEHADIIIIIDRSFHEKK